VANKISYKNPRDLGPDRLI